MRRRAVCEWAVSCRTGVAAACAAGWLAAAAAQEAEPPEPAAEQRVEQLEAAIGQQQQRLAELSRSLAARQDTQRLEILRAQIREILSEQEFREALAPATMLAGYDDGFYIRSADDRFKLKFGGKIQFRFTHYGTRAGNRYLNPGLQRDDRTGFELERVRFTFSGHVHSPDWTYLVELRSDTSDQADVRLHYGWVNYRLAEELQFKAGIFRLASTRQQITSDSNLQFIDRPMTDAVFGLGIGLGARVWGRLADKRFEYFLDVVNSLNTTGNRVITPDPAEMDGNPAILLRTVWHALGDNPPKDFVTQADLQQRQSPALDLAMHYAFNEDRGDARTTRIPVPRQILFDRGGGFGLVSTNGLQIHQLGVDTAFKWRGFSATAEYILRVVDVRRTNPLRGPVAPWFLASGDQSTTAQHGAYAQVGYLLPIPGFENKLELVARVGGISALADEQEGVWEYTGGVNYYIRGNDVKLQMEVSRVYEVPTSSASSSLATVNDDALIFRTQLQLGF